MLERVAGQSSGMGYCDEVFAGEINERERFGIVHRCSDRSEECICLFCASKLDCVEELADVESVSCVDGAKGLDRVQGLDGAEGLDCIAGLDDTEGVDCVCGLLVCVHGIDEEGLYGEPSCGGAATGVAAVGAADVAAFGAAGVAAVGIAAGGGADGAVGGADGAVGIAAGGGADGAVGVAAGGGATGAVAGDDTVPVASVALDGTDCDELTSANRCCSIIQINITQLPVSYDCHTLSTTL